MAIIRGNDTSHEHDENTGEDVDPWQFEDDDVAMQAAEHLAVTLHAVPDLEAPDTTPLVADFFVIGGGMRKDSETYVTIVFPKEHREVALALHDMMGKMIQGTFQPPPPPETNEGVDEDDIRRWYQEQFGQ